MVELGRGTDVVTAARVALPFRIGARTIASVSRRLIRIGWSLDQALTDEPVALPNLDGGADGYLLRSVPADRVPDGGGLLAGVRQRYRRYFVDLTIGRAAWLAALSATTRATMRRKANRLAAAGTIEIARYRTPDEIAAFHAPARAVSATTYQERLLGSGLPADPAALQAAAAADGVRAWLLRIDDRPTAYLCCIADGDTLRYDHVGHDPADAVLSPGAVLQATALEDLFDDRFARFDFTEGEGQHKRIFATGSVACVDVLLLRPTPANRLLLLALMGFDAGVALAKRVAARPALAGVRRRLLRAG